MNKFDIMEMIEKKIDEGIDQQAACDKVAEELMENDKLQEFDEELLTVENGPGYGYYNGVYISPELVESIKIEPILGTDYGFCLSFFMSGQEYYDFHVIREG